MINLEKFTCEPQDIIVLSIPVDSNNDFVWDLESVQNMYNNIHQLFPNNNILCLPQNVNIQFISERNPFLQ